MVNCDLLIIAYDYSLPIATLLKEAGVDRGYSVEIVSPDRCSVDITSNSAVALIYGEQFQAKIILTRGIRHVYPFFATWLKLAENEGSQIFNSIYSMYLSLDKLATLAHLASSGIRIVPAVAVVAPPKALPYLGENLVKPAFGSKGTGVARTTLEHLRRRFEAVNNTASPILEHQIIQPLVTPYGIDYRSVVLDGDEIAQTKRTAPKGTLTTNGHNALIERSEDQHIRALAIEASKAIELKLAGVDIIYFEGAPAVLEVNCWPGLFETSRASGVNIAEKIIESCEHILKK